MRHDTKRYAVMVRYWGGGWDFALSAPLFSTWTAAYEYQTKIWIEYSKANPDWTRDRFAIVRIESVEFTEVARGPRSAKKIT